MVRSQPIPRGGRAAQAPGDLAQHRVAGGMPIAAIDPFEMIEVDQQYREGPGLAYCQRGIVVGVVEKGVPAEQAGERIIAGQAAHFLLFPVQA